MPEQPKQGRIATGVPGLDEVLQGGYPYGRMVLVEGPPGSGKTTLALQFLAEGRRRGEQALHITMSETAEEIVATAASHGFDLDRETFFEIFPPLEIEAQFALFHPEEVELTESASRIRDEIARRRPGRVVIDSLSGLRMLFPDSLHFRRYLLLLKRQFAAAGSTALVLEPVAAGECEPDLEAAVDAVIELERYTRAYGTQRRRLQMKKMRDSGYEGGYHDFRIQTGGLTVYPRVAPEPGLAFRWSGEVVSSGNPELDGLLGGGLGRGKSALLVGASGTGKSVIASQFAAAAAERGEPVQMFLFDELPDSCLNRAEALGMRLRAPLESGLLNMQYFDAASLSPGEFANAAARASEREGRRLVIVDSLSSYLLTMGQEEALPLQLHDLLAFLSQRNVVTLMVLVQSGMIGPDVESPVDLSYLSDAVILFRHFEAQGAIRKSLAVVKKNYGAHESTIRELRFTAGAVRVGPPLVEFQGVLTSVPVFTGAAGGSGPLLTRE
jgi:circadian clock protein KaiC